MLAYNIIAGQPEEIVEESTVMADEESVVPAAGESYLIAFASDHLGTYDLFVIDLAGQRMVCLTKMKMISYHRLR